jgi:cyanoexosortase B
MQSTRPTRLQTLSQMLSQAWANLLVLFLLLLLYGPLLLHWYQGWLKKTISIEHEYFSHGVIGLPFAAYVVWTNRQTWQRLPGGTGAWGGADRWSGLFFLLLGGFLYLSGLPDPVNLSLPLVLTGVVLWLKGLPGFRLLGFPLLLVWLATPNELPYLITPFTFPLQCFIASIAGVLLNLTGFPVVVDTIHLYVNGRVVEVAPYCAGLKMLFTSLYVALMLLYWTGTLSSRRFILIFLGSTLGISVTANIIRNTILTYFHGTGNDAGFAWLHEGWGGDVYSSLMLGSLVLLIRYLEPRLLPNAAAAVPDSPA